MVQPTGQAITDGVREVSMGSVEPVKTAVVQQTDATEKLAKGSNRMSFYIIAISVAILVVSLLALLLHFI